MTLVDFLVNAKKATYARGKKPVVLEDGFEELTYRQNGYSYSDRWEGSNSFGGQERVSKQGKVIWLMHYYGALTSSGLPPEQVYAFLRKAMAQVSKERPFRGPRLFRKGDLLYTDHSEGDVSSFHGIERIYFRSGEIYRLNYHGGKVC